MKTISMEITTENGNTGTWNRCFEMNGNQYGYIALDAETCHDGTHYLPCFVQPWGWLARRSELIILEEHPTAPMIFVCIGTDEGMTSYCAWKWCKKWMDRIEAMSKLDTFRRLEEIIDRLSLGKPTMRYQEMYQRIALIDCKQHLDQEVFEVFILLLLEQRQRADSLAYTPKTTVFQLEA